MFGLDFSTVFGLTSHAQEALKTSGDWLPNVSVYVEICTFLTIGAIGAILLLKDISLGVKLALGAAAFAFLTACAIGYEAKGENKIIPKLNAANARIANDEARAESFRNDAALLRARLAQEAKLRKIQDDAVAKSFKEKLDAQNPSVGATRIPGAAGVPINKLIAETNDTVIAAGTGSDAAAAALAAAETTIRDWQDWGGKVILQYRALAQQIKGLRDYAHGLGDAEIKAATTVTTTK